MSKSAVDSPQIRQSARRGIHAVASAALVALNKRCNTDACDKACNPRRSAAPIG